MGKIQSGSGSGTTGDMKVLFIITVRGHGRGGHFHSLNHISQAMGDKIDVGICTYGTGKSNVLENSPYFKKHINYNANNFLTYKRQLQSILLEYKPDILHFFDATAYTTFSTFFRVNKYSTFVNKCGGPNPVDFPLVQNLILFSEENQSWFKQNAKFDKTNIAVIPNRVNPKLLMFNFDKKINKKDAFCFVRIARIGTAYKKSIEDSIRLVERLSQKGLNVHLYIIGTIQEKEVANEINSKIKNLPVTMLNDDAFTQKASDMLYLADAVIATGRGIMEATSLGKPILTPAQNSDLPILISENNFKQFFATNFSERNTAAEHCLQSNLSKIHKLVTEKDYYEKMSNFSSQQFELNFSTDSVSSKYLKFYSDGFNVNNLLKFSLATNWKFKLKAWYSFIK